jgi:hypothetical protein
MPKPARTASDGVRVGDVNNIKPAVGTDGHA